MGGAANNIPAPTLRKPATPQAAPDADGFISRWLLLEPIPAPSLTQNAVQELVKKEYFPNQFTVIPRDGDKVTVANKELTWHAVETKLYNVNLFHFARERGISLSFLKTGPTTSRSKLSMALIFCSRSPL